MDKVLKNCKNKGLRDLTTEQSSYSEGFKATTEAYNNYIKSDVVHKKEWHAGAKERACDVCKKNQSVGAIPLNEVFPSGHLYPPAGLGCGCTLLPVVD